MQQLQNAKAFIYKIEQTVLKYIFPVQLAKMVVEYACGVRATCERELLRFACTFPPVAVCDQLLQDAEKEPWLQYYLG